MKILITGGAGFIGCNFARHVLKEHPEKEIVVLDKLTYAGRLENLEEIKNRITFVRGDICDKEVVGRVVPGCDEIVNFAAESHVDRSIATPEDFVRTDVLGVFTLLEAARKNDVKKFLQISTDEVYGSTESSSFTENDKLDPSSPYSASKAGGELLARSYARTYGLNVVVTRSSNNYGPFQYPEKLIPVLIIKALRNEPLPIYGNGTNVRDWLYVGDNCSAIDLVIRKAKAGDIINVGSGNEIPNLEIAKLVLKHLRKPESLIKFVEDRRGHDFRYSLTWDRIRELGWKPQMALKVGLRRTIDWYVSNEGWWRALV